MDLGTADADLGSLRDGSKTDDEVVQREEEAIKIDGLNVSQVSCRVFRLVVKHGSKQHLLLAKIDHVIYFSR